MKEPRVQILGFLSLSSLIYKMGFEHLSWEAVRVLRLESLFFLLLTVWSWVICALIRLS